MKFCQHFKVLDQRGIRKKFEVDSRIIEVGSEMTIPFLKISASCKQINKTKLLHLTSKLRADIISGFMTA